MVEHRGGARWLPKCLPEEDLPALCGSTINPFPVINFYRCQCSETDVENEDRENSLNFFIFINVFKFLIIFYLKPLALIN